MSNVNSYVDKALAKVADLIVQRMEDLKGENWQRPWFNTTHQSVPQNLSGRPYNGMNQLILGLETAVKQRELPVFLTFNQAMKEGVHIKKGSTSTPIFYYERTYRDENGKKVPDDIVREMSLEEKAKLNTIALLKKFDVFNLADTNFQEIHPERYEQLKSSFMPKEVKDEQGMYSNKELDRMFSKQEWLCPIEVKYSEGAYYTPSSDRITLPLKAQFKIGTSTEEIYRDGMEFYSTALHEMAHSTGTASRLNREIGGKFGGARYAKEELVAELTAALTGQTLGFDRKISDNSAKYLNNWVGALKSEPRFVLTVLGDVAKAHGVIMGEVEKQQIIQQQPSQEQKGKKSRSLYELQAQYDRINSRYPYAVNDEKTRQILNRINQANSIITTYEQNIQKIYGTDWLRDPKNAHTPIPQDVYTGRQMQSDRIVGIITWKDTGETMYFSDKEKYLSTLKAEFNTNPGIFTYKTITKDGVTLKAVDDVVYALHGLKNPNSLKDYTLQVEDIQRATLVKMRDGSFAVRAKINGVDTGLMPIKTQDAVTYMKISEQHQRDKFLNELVSKTSSLQNPLPSLTRPKTLHP